LLQLLLEQALKISLLLDLFFLLSRTVLLVVVPVQFNPPVRDLVQTLAKVPELKVRSGFWTSIFLASLLIGVDSFVVSDVNVVVNVLSLSKSLIPKNLPFVHSFGSPQNLAAGS
jgi:hypothetical protein